MTTRNRSRLARLRHALASTGILAVVGLFMLTLTLPATAPFAAADGAQDVDAPVRVAVVQSLEVAENAEAADVVRGDYGVTSYAELLREKYGSGYYGSVGGAWTGAVRWPFPYPVPMTDGFGQRAAPCNGCSTMHRGIDLLPGSGTPIFAIANGVVADYQEGWGYGTHVFVDHEIGGQRVTSLYAHMQAGSSPLRPGDSIKVGDFVGLVGSTGAVTAPHLHLEIRVDGVAINPLPWLSKHAS